MTLEKVKELLYKSESYKEAAIIDMVKLAGYRIKKDMKTKKDWIIIKK